MRIFLPWTIHRSSSTVLILWPIQLLFHRALNVGGQANVLDFGAQSSAEINACTGDIDGGGIICRAHIPARDVN